MNRQTVFDTVVKHLRTQKERAVMSNETSCSYRLEKNGKILKCAVGIFIPKELHNYDMEGFGVSTLVYKRKEYKLPFGIFNKRNLPLLTSLQNIHDTLRSWDKKGLSKKGEISLQNTARLFKLTYTPPN